MPLFKINPEIAIGIFLITTGVFTFAKGTSQHLADYDFKKSKEHIEKILNTVKSSNFSINNNNSENNEDDE